MPFPCYKFLLRAPRGIWPSCFPRLLLAMTISQTCFVSDDFDSFQDYLKLFCRMSLYLFLSVSCFSWLDRSCDFGEQVHSSEVSSSSHFTKGTGYQRDITGNGNMTTGSWNVFQVFNCQIFFPHPFYALFF